jgi:hypothetical protein
MFKADLWVSSFSVYETMGRAPRCLRMAPVDVQRHPRAKKRRNEHVLAAAEKRLTYCPSEAVRAPPGAPSGQAPFGRPPR